MCTFACLADSNPTKSHLALYEGQKLTLRPPYTFAVFSSTLLDIAREAIVCQGVVSSTRRDAPGVRSALRHSCWSNVLTDENMKNISPRSSCLLILQQVRTAYCITRIHGALRPYNLWADTRAIKANRSSWQVWVRYRTTGSKRWTASLQKSRGGHRNNERLKSGSGSWEPRISVPTQ